MYEIAITQMLSMSKRHGITSIMNCFLSINIFYDTFQESSLFMLILIYRLISMNNL